MGRNLVLLLMAIVLATAVVGCGREENKLVTGAKAAKPVDIGDPGQYAMGATLYSSSFWVVKETIDGENRLVVLGRKVPTPTQTELTEYVAAEKVFTAPGTRFRYDILGNALHKIPKGPNEGQPGIPLDLYKVELDSNNHVLLHTYKKLATEERSNKEVGAYVVVP